MQKIFFKKMVDLNHQLKELVSISVDESINYKLESQGMRAYGSIMINGEYKDSQAKKDFHETIHLDILALFSKIEDRNEFNVKVDDFDYYLNDGNLSLVIQASIYGVKDDEDRVIETDEIITEKTNVEPDIDVSEDIENLLREQDEVIENIPEPINVPEPIEDVKQPLYVEDMPKIQSEMKADVQQDNDDVDMGTYYLYVVQDGDTYATIASRYHVDEFAIQSYNHDRTLSKGTIVIIPYIS